MKFDQSTCDYHTVVAFQVSKKCFKRIPSDRTEVHVSPVFMHSMKNAQNKINQA